MANKTSTNKKAIAVGAGLALAAAAAGAYLFYGKDAPKRRKQIKSWAMKAKAEVLEQIEQLPAIDEKTYNKVVAEVTKRYKALKNVDAAELASLVKELNGYWREIKKHVPKDAEKAAAKAVKQIKKTAKKVKKQIS